MKAAWSDSKRNKNRMTKDELKKFILEFEPYNYGPSHNERLADAIFEHLEKEKQTEKCQHKNCPVASDGTCLECRK